MMTSVLPTVPLHSAALLEKRKACRSKSDITSGVSVMIFPFRNRRVFEDPFSAKSRPLFRSVNLQRQAGTVGFRRARAAITRYAE